MANVCTEQLSFHLFSFPLHALILGLPWLSKHNPHINCGSGEMSSWGKDCTAGCFKAPSISKTSSDHKLPFPELSPGIAHPDYPDSSKVPKCYHNLKEVFKITCNFPTSIRVVFTLCTKSGGHEEVYLSFPRGGDCS